MIIEYFIDKDYHRKLLYGYDLTTSNNVEVKKRSQQSKGKDNYLLTLSTADNTEEGAKALSEIHGKFKTLFEENKIYYRILTNGAAQFYAKELYPVICGFETQLRKFVHSTLFDVDEVAQKRIAEGLKANVPSLKGCNNIKKVDFLERATLGDVYYFLFQKIDICAQIETYITAKKGKYNKEELIKFVENIPETSIWEEFFAKEFSDSELPNMLKEISVYRNDVMHFHDIDYSTYTKAKEELKKANKDLRKQIAKGIVFENTEVNITKLFNNIAYCSGISSALADLGSIFKGWRNDLVLNATSALKTYKSLLPDFSIFSFDDPLKTQLNGITAALAGYKNPILDVNFPKALYMEAMMPTIQSNVELPSLEDEELDKQEDSTQDVEENIEEGEKKDGE